ncbi:MAG: hypothetical protein EA359_17685 [Balneolaceae bacterium]|nr:MAG: hypothetical protein EA359_17685 [Balneolaceae bacterium]
MVLRTREHHIHLLIRNTETPNYLSFNDVMKYHLVYIILFICCCTAVAQGPVEQIAETNIKTNSPLDIRPGTAENPVMTALRLTENNSISIDGFLNEEVWLQAPVATSFTQRSPNDGRAASERTEVRILYTDNAIYVGFMAYDSSPDSIMAPLFRRDGNQPSDWVYVGFDSYDDSRTGFVFGVNPRGVQRDFLYFNDSNMDLQWNAVWDARTQILENGWSAEIRIPTSQLRFSAVNDIQSWGINFSRTVARKGESSFWAPTPQSDTRMVSRYGRLNGIQGLDEPMRLEVMPYAAGSLLRAPDLGTSSPYYNRNQFRGNIGGDIKYGLTSSLTLTATINPDFGQVEADPSVINLTANESFFSEQRPFFQEGSDIFQFGGTKSFFKIGHPQTFYSRRIGRAPQGSPARAGESAMFTDQPDQTTIAGAVKLSGKTDSGWSIGAMNAFTLQENARFITPSDVEHKIAVEPAANYLVTRTMRDFNAGNTYAGGFFSAVNRNINDTYFENFLRNSAYLGGLDFEHNFKNRNWVASGVVSYSVINGSQQAIALAQRSPVRYFNRVDSDKLNFDSERTSLTGYATEMSIRKQGGSKWLGSLTWSDVNPGYETNDLGFQNRSDYRMLAASMIYRNTNLSWLQFFEQSVASLNGWNYDGDKIYDGIRSMGFMRFNNLWTANYNVNYTPRLYSDRLTRGGPVITQPSNVMLNLFVGTNPNKTFSFGSGLIHMWNEDGGYLYDYLGVVTSRPSTWLTMSFSPLIVKNKNTMQYVSTVQDAEAVHTYGNRYLFADIEQNTVALDTRINWTFSPTMSLQTYVRPFVSSGKYSNFKELSAPRSFDFDVYGEDMGTITKSDGRYFVDSDGTGSSNFSFRDPDFNFRSIQGNAVFRWEYRPGSTLFFVWQQQRSSFEDSGDYALGRDLGELFRSKPTNVFLIKGSYWFG